MSRSFLTVLTEVLAERPQIPELPDDQLNAMYGEYEGEEVQSPNIDDILLKKIARLQTLSVREHQRCRMPEVVEMRSAAGLTGASFPNVFAGALSIAEDSTRRIEMLEQLIVEAVRDAIPSECDIMDVGYALHLTGKLLRLPMLRHHFD